MSQRSSRTHRHAGFTLIEVMVTLISVTTILVVSAQLMFAMRRGLVRQQLQVEARQNVRAALDYTSMLLRGASDFNKGSANAGAVLTWVFAQSQCHGCTPPATIPCPTQDGCYQVSYNNVTSTNNGSGILADEGTDIITIGRPEGTITANAVSTPDFANLAQSGWLTPGCTAADAAASAVAFTAFKAATGAGTGTVSDRLAVAGDGGGWTFYKITDYQDSDNSTLCCIPRSACAIAGVNLACILTKGNLGGPLGIKPPGGNTTLQNQRLLTGTRFVSLRVRTDPITHVPWLEQKDGLFDPAADNPGGAFVPILPNIEDMQVAWIFNNGDVKNNSSANRLGLTGQVPQAGGSATTDVQNVVGFRVTFTARSSQGMTLESARFFRPAAEDHDAGTARDTVYRYQASANAMIRNRMMGM
jgi:prepilin-type N-terminal cleavage/methylation domain-containing protein